MNITIKLLCLIVAVIVATPLLAAPGGWMPLSKKISGVVVEGSETSGTALILIEGGVQSGVIPPECNSPYNTVDLTTEKGRGILSLALSARMSDKPVKLALTCKGTRPFITHIWL